MSKRAKKSVKQRKVKRSFRHESLEDRVVLSADPLGGPMMTTHGFGGGFQESDTVESAPPLSQHGAGGLLGSVALEQTPVFDPNADFWLHSDLGNGFWEQDLDQKIEQTLHDAHELTGQDQVVSKYGFDGGGQTVVVIDSGIAWSHTALGGGLGSGYRVVGGWDFTENDADPYDDYSPTSGAHGTHVAGIIGAEGTTHSGVATGVDLIGLRVFDDAGNGYFSWVRSALQWVHTNKDAYDNPITAVNLSLGAAWNSTSLPGWAMLEAEFAQLEADGIFISVSAGNDFDPTDAGDTDGDGIDFSTPGLSYPAASSHVIPVMSVDDSGALSYFSQRADYAIAAPGRGIVSTVPDYAAGDADTIDDDWASYSGTSMAAPYTAGASVLIREAMEFVGMTGIDQWDIYNHMMATGDQFYDALTSDTYTRLNLEAAIDALMPTDDYGSSVATAHNLGTVSGAQSIGSGVISTLDDGDYFTFTAGATGTVTFTADTVSHNLVTSWSGWGGANWAVDGDSCSMDVVAGQTYTVALATSGGLGYYDLSIDLDSSITYVDWGAASIQQTQSGLSVDGEQWYRVTAAQAGIFTAETLVQAGSATVEIYDSNLTSLTAEAARADADVTQGQELFIKVTGVGASLDLRLTNAIALSASSVTVTGTSNDDSFTFAVDGSWHNVTFNGVDYDYYAGAFIDDVSFVGNGGEDSITITGSANETATLRAGSATVTSSAGWTVTTSGVENATVNGGGGTDLAYFIDTAGNDILSAHHDYAVMHASDYSYQNQVNGFARTFSYSNNGGEDYAYLYGSSAGDLVNMFSDRAFMRADDASYNNQTTGFERVYAYAGAGGADLAYFTDSAAADIVVARHDSTLMRAADNSYLTQASGFARTFSYSINGGADYAYLYGSSAGDVLNMKTTLTFMRADDASYENHVDSFDRVFAYSGAGGMDLAYLTDSAGSDYLIAREDSTTMYAADNSYYNQASGFTRSFSYAYGGGTDYAYMYDSAKADTFVGRPTYSALYANDSSFLRRAYAFDRVYAYAVNGGADSAVFYGTSGSDLLKSWATHSIMRADNLSAYYHAEGFENLLARGYAAHGDTALFYDTDLDEAFSASNDTATMVGGGSTTSAEDFATVRAIGGAGGTDSLNVNVPSLEFAFEQVSSWV